MKIGIEDFPQWFGSSMVLDADGRPLEVFHGSGRNFGTFDMSKARDGAHFFTPNASHAASFGTARGFYLRIENPLEISQDDLEAAWDVEHPDGDQDERNLLPRDFVGAFVAKAKAAGHDALIIREMGDRDIQADMYLPFEPAQICPSVVPVEEYVFPHELRQLANALANDIDATVRAIYVAESGDPEATYESVFNWLTEPRQVEQYSVGAIQRLMQAGVDRNEPQIAKLKAYMRGLDKDKRPGGIVVARELDPKGEAASEVSCEYP